jgi:hypothetical protein
LVKYMSETNDIEQLKKSRKKIKIIIDEWPLYFYADDFRKLDVEKLKPLTQCRKRNIEVIIITQRFWFVVKKLRTLTNYVLQYKKYLRWLIIKWEFKEILNLDTTEIYSEDNLWKSYEIVSTQWFFPFLHWFFYKDYFLFKHISFNIVWFQKKLVHSYTDFKKSLEI